MCAPPADRPLRVLFFDHETRLSGGEQDLLDLATALSSKQHDLHVGLPAGLSGSGPLGEALARVGVSVHEFQMHSELRQTSRWALARDPFMLVGMIRRIWVSSRSFGVLMDRIKPDVVHTNSMKAHLLALMPARLRGIPLIWHVRDILEPGWLLRSLSFLGGSGPRKILCISKGVAAQFEGSSASAVTQVVYNGIAVEKFLGRDETEISRLRESLGAGDDHVSIGIVGQISRWKGQDTFIEAAAKVLEAVAYVRFAIVGECLFPENEGAYENTLHERASELGLDDTLVWAGWRDDPAGVMSALDIVVHASRLPEPFGRVIVEAMAAGKPIVASARGAGPEIVQPGEGFVIEPDDPDRLAEVLVQLSSDRALRDEMGHAARLGANRFDISKTAEGVEGVYEAL